MADDSSRRDADDADIDLDTQELDDVEYEPLGYGPGEWASTVPVHRRKESEGGEPHDTSEPPTHSDSHSDEGATPPQSPPRGRRPRDT
jgi:hypothetical protein